MATVLHSTPRVEIEMGRPQFPVLDWTNEVLTRPHVGSLVTSNSWLIFNLLGLEGPQDWLQMPSEMWPMFTEYRKLEDFCSNLRVTNDLAERGIHLISEFIHKTKTEKQSQALLQVVEYHRKQIPTLSKENLSKCQICLNSTYVFFICKEIFITLSVIFLSSQPYLQCNIKSNKYLSYIQLHTQHRYS